MKKWEPLNMEIRSWVISQVLRLEQTSSDALKPSLDFFNENSKTLGNQSSALSFKSKIDLLYDLEEIDKTEYNHLLKLMEIRNQFAHNPYAVSFEALDSINPDINRYLLKYENKMAGKDQTNEARLKSVFNQLFVLTVGKLLVIEMEYSKGIEKEMRKHLNDKIVENIEEIWRNALQMNNEQKSETPILLILNNGEKEIEKFYLNFRIAMSKYFQTELRAIAGDKMKAVFKQKVTSKKTYKELNKDVEEKN